MDDKPVLAGLQTAEQRRILDTITQIRKCGLEGVLSLPQIVVCGDQSAGKSSVMEALTGIPFPRNDNLCTRFATEISLRHEPEHQLTVKLIPGSNRSLAVQERMSAFSETITDFSELPRIIDAAMNVMGINDPDGASSRAFARDTLSVHLVGPGQPHVTLVDIPGLVSSATKGVTDDDIATVAEITEHYISQPRTICLAVIQATNDAANQSILQKVRKFDPRGERTLGVVTKVDVLPPGSDTEAKFLELARNEDVVFSLGWHVVKNRNFLERSFSLEERNASERDFFEGSAFGRLLQDNIGIDALRSRLSRLLLDHVKKELPHLRDEAEDALRNVNCQISRLGKPRGTMGECRSYLIDLSMVCHEICKAGVNGHYEDGYFRCDSDTPFSLDSESAVTRLRAFIQQLNSSFSETLRTHGHKYRILDNDAKKKSNSKDEESELIKRPILLRKTDARNWVHKMLIRSRGKELIGNFAPHLLNELFWEQSERWEKLATGHVEDVYRLCELFLLGLLSKKAPRSMRDRLWSSIVGPNLEFRRTAALNELGELIKDNKSCLMNYNHYYVADFQSRRESRLLAQVKPAIGFPTDQNNWNTTQNHMESSQASVTQDMEAFTCDEALDYLQSIYKVQQKTFLANVTTQVIERHLIRDLESMFSPSNVTKLTDDIVTNIVSESSFTQEQRRCLQDRRARLEEGVQILRHVAPSNTLLFRR